MMVAQPQVVAEEPEVDGQERYLEPRSSRPWGGGRACQREAGVQVTPGLGSCCQVTSPWASISGSVKGGNWIF